MRKEVIEHVAQSMEPNLKNVNESWFFQATEVGRVRVHHDTTGAHGCDGNFFSGWRQEMIYVFSVECRKKR